LNASSSGRLKEGVNGLCIVIFATVFFQNFASALSQEGRHFIMLRNKMHQHGMETPRFSSQKDRGHEVCRQSNGLIVLGSWRCFAQLGTLSVAGYCTALICLHTVIKLNVLYFPRKVFCFCLIMHSCTSPYQPITFSAFSVEDVQALCIWP
jgi:hypothetical protein